jgi:hypothetical protein
LAACFVFASSIADWVVTSIALLNNLKYRHFSPQYPLGRRFRPHELRWLDGADVSGVPSV